jgi:hypothetical protein
MVEILMKKWSGFMAMLLLSLSGFGNMFLHLPKKKRPEIAVCHYLVNDNIA